MIRLALCFLLALAAPALADTTWVQAGPDGYEARLVTERTSCPPLETASGPVPMTERAAPSDKFPRVCSAALPPNAHGVTVGGMPLPRPVANPRRILVLGDTGCRIHGDRLQACNDPRAWPFPQLAAAAAKLKPDLIIHVGDYLYRENRCPADFPGCTGSPWGDNWTTWQADFFSPGAPLFAAAPLVILRGNHEECSRAGAGWFRLLGPGRGDAPCARHLPLYAIDLGDLRLAVMDDASAPDRDIANDDLPAYAAEIRQMGALTPPVWFLHHKPVWAAGTEVMGIPAGGNPTLIQAAGNVARGRVMPGTVELQLSGHIHSFQALNYRDGVPPQIVAGNGGDSLMPVPENLRGTVFQGHSGVSVRDGVALNAFGFLLMTRSPGGWDIQLYDSDGRPQRQCRFTDTHRNMPPRVDCPPAK